MINIILFSIADRVRGTTSIAVWLMAYLFSAFFDYNIWIILAFVLGEATSWGAPLGAILQRRSQGNDSEWWQSNFLTKRPELSNILRGAWWGFCPAIVSYYLGLDNAIIAFISLFIPFIIAPFIARSINQDYISSWQLSEYIRGGLIGLSLSVLL